MSNFTSHLDILMEEESSSWPFHVQSVDLSKRLEDAKHLLLTIQHKIASLKFKIVHDLAMRVRKRAPTLNVSVDKASCKIGYKTKSLTFKPNIEDQVWDIESNDSRFLREFLNIAQKHTVMSADIDGLLGDLIEYFNKQYRSFNEETEKGIILINNKKATLLELAGLTKPLNTRSMRLIDER